MTPGSMKILKFLIKDRQQTHGVTAIARETNMKAADVRMRLGGLQRQKLVQKHDGTFNTAYSLTAKGIEVVEPKPVHPLKIVGVEDFTANRVALFCKVIVQDAKGNKFQFTSAYLADDIKPYEKGRPE